MTINSTAGWTIIIVGVAVLVWLIVRGLKNKKKLKDLSTNPKEQQTKPVQNSLS